MLLAGNLKNGGHMSPNMGYNYSYPILTLDPEPYNLTLGGPKPPFQNPCAP